MKLESLRSSKFEAFKKSEIVNLNSIKSGGCLTTLLPNTNKPHDTYNVDWSRRKYNGVEITREECDFGKLNDPRCADQVITGEFVIDITQEGYYVSFF